MQGVTASHLDLVQSLLLGSFFKPLLKEMIKFKTLLYINILQRHLLSLVDLIN